MTARVPPSYKVPFAPLEFYYLNFILDVCQEGSDIEREGKNIDDDLPEWIVTTSMTDTASIVSGENNQSVVIHPHLLQCLDHF